MEADVPVTASRTAQVPVLLTRHLQVLLWMKQDSKVLKCPCTQKALPIRPVLFWVFSLQSSGSRLKERWGNPRFTPLFTGPAGESLPQPQGALKTNLQCPHSEFLPLKW